MNLNNLVPDCLLAVSFGFFAIHESWQSVCVILICAILKSACVYLDRQEKHVDIKNLEARLAQTAADVKNVSFKLGFAR